MKRSWTAWAVALVAILIVGCNDYGNTFQNNTGAVLSFLSPSNIGAGNADFTLTINGSGFLPKTYATWNGKKLATTYNFDNVGNIVSLSATVPAALVAKVGTAAVITQSPFSGAGNNGLSNAITFIINPPPNPLPTLSAIAPNQAAACGGSCAPITLDLTGTNFLPGSSTTPPTGASQVFWTANGTQTSLTTSAITATDIKATIPGSLLSVSGSATVTVFNPPSQQPAPPSGVSNPAGGGGGNSGPLTFTICATLPCATPAHTSKTVNGASVSEETPSVSADGRYVAFTAVEGEHTQVFLRDTCEGATAACQQKTALLSVAFDGNPADGDSHAPSINSDGRYVAFSSAATNLFANAPAGRQVYLRDTCLGVTTTCTPATQLVSTDSAGALVGTESILPSISSSGRFVVFLAITASHVTTNPAPKADSTEPNSGYRQVFIRDLCFGVSACTPKTTRLSMQPGDGTSTQPAGPAVSGAGKNVAVPAGNSATLFNRSVPVDDGIVLTFMKGTN